MEKNFDSDSLKSINAMEMLSNCLVQLKENHDQFRDLVDTYYRERFKKEFKNEFITIIDKDLFIIGDVKETKIKIKPHIIFWMWNNYLYPTYTLTFYIKNKKEKVHQYRAFFAHDSEELNLFLNKQTKIILLKNKSIVEFYTIDISKVDRSYWNFLDNKHPYESIRDFKASKIYIEYQFNKNIEKVKATWSERLNEFVATSILNYKDPKNNTIIKKEREKLKETSFNALFSDNINIFSEIYSYYLDELCRKNRNPIEENYRIRSELEGASFYQELLNRMMTAAWFSSELTSCGQKIISLDLEGGRSEFYITNEKLGDCSGFFWSRLPFRLPMYFSDLMGELHCPIEPEKFISEIPVYQGDIDKGEEFVENLLAEAMFMKKWTIPYGANVLLEAGPIKSAKFFELGFDVACILYNQLNHFMLIWVNPSEQKFSFIWHENFYHIISNRALKGLKINQVIQDRHISEVSTNELVRKVELGLKILIAAIIRDFWVVEERKSVFGSSNIRVSNTGKHNKRNIIYLPRIKYVKDIQNSGESLNYVNRRPHFVTGHLRAAQKASESQIVLAQKYGIVVPEGFTFVRPHKRGDKAMERIYRSRSALHCIKALQQLANTTNDDKWFSYELRVKKWLEDNYYEVNHISASRNGDGGVDIQAQKENEFLLIQCKYWQSKKVGPSVVREMLGTMQTFPAGSKGVIISTAELTKEAQDFAIKYGIQYISGVDFENEINIPINFKG